MSDSALVVSQSRSGGVPVYLKLDGVFSALFNHKIVAKHFVSGQNFRPRAITNAESDMYYLLRMSGSQFGNGINEYDGGDDVGFWYDALKFADINEFAENIYNRQRGAYANLARLMGPDFLGLVNRF